MMPKHYVPKEELLDMDLHERIDINLDLAVIRVFGGWIYLMKDTSNRLDRSSITSVFVKETG